jgi:hypothetical protein
VVNHRRWVRRWPSIAALSRILEVPDDHHHIVPAVNMSTDLSAYDPSDAIRAAVTADPLVQSVELVGSRAARTATVLSVWDYRIRSADPSAVAERLPDLVVALKPLAHLWDPLAASPVYIVVLPGAVKVDLFPGSPPGPSGWRTRPATLGKIDHHFWDWNLWLGSKRLRGQDELVSAELTKMWEHLLRPLGAARPPATQQQAVGAYLELRRRHELQLGHPLCRDLGNAVITRLRAAGLL